MELSLRILQLRRKANLSQESLAEALGVSRQAVAKWEAAEALPELGHVVALGRFFRVSYDELLGELACSPAGKTIQAPAPDSMVAFLIRAKLATYAGNRGQTNPSRCQSHDLAYEEGEYSYLDTYLGSRSFSGEEAVWKAGQPVWAMNYSGRVVGEGFSGDFLKEALSRVDETLPYRGPRLYRRNDLTFHCHADGSFSWFQGREEIYREDRLVYECVFHGGMVD